MKHSMTEATIQYLLFNSQIKIEIITSRGAHGVVLCAVSARIAVPLREQVQGLRHRHPARSHGVVDVVELRQRATSHVLLGSRALPAPYFFLAAGASFLGGRGDVFLLVLGDDASADLRDHHVRFRVC